ncbi:MAG: P-loop NTPase fold protein [Microcystaceae cyanobacterium]
MQLGNPIILSNGLTYQLYTGHRGAGKSTELKRLKKHLENSNFHVVYFAAGDDLDEEDIQYTDILLACTRYLLEDLKNKADVSPLVNWLENRWTALKDLALTEITFDKINLEVGIAQFAKVMAVMRESPSTRQSIQQEFEKHTSSLIDELNKFIDSAKKELDNNCFGIVVIADNLDRIALVFDQASQRSNHDQIFIDRSEQLRRLKCHMIYTVPISMAYSDRATILEDRFAGIQSLPMVMTHTPDESIYPDGINKLKELVEKRINLVDYQASSTDVFENDAVFINLCFQSGGHVRNLVLLVRIALERTGKLPISKKAALRAIAEMRNTYRKGINDDEWPILAKVHLSKHKSNNYQCNKLLFNRSILEYHLVEDNDIKPWYDVHPLILDIEEFQQALEKEKNLKSQDGEEQK